MTIVCSALGAVALIALATAASLAAFGTRAVVLHGDEVWQPGVRKAPQFTLRDQDGRLTALRVTRGKPTVVAFMYSHCREICPIEGELLGEVERSFIDAASQPRVLVVSVDPSGDTAQSIRSFALKWGWTGDWRWLVGSRKQLVPIWRAYGIDVKAERASVGHSAALYVLDSRGYERAGYVVPFLSRDLIADLHPLLANSDHRTRDLLLAAAALSAAAALTLAAARLLVPEATPDGPRNEPATQSAGQKPARQRSKTRSVSLALLTGAFALAAAGTLWPSASSGKGPAAIIPARVRAPAPSLDHAQVLLPPRLSLSQERGHVTLINFWASWCYPCQKEAPQLARFAKTPAGRGRLVGIDVNDQKKPALRFIYHYQLNYPNLSDNHAALFNQYGLVGLPTTIVIDKNGRIAARLIGPQTTNTLRRAMARVG